MKGPVTSTLMRYSGVDPKKSAISGSKARQKAGVLALVPATSSLVGTEGAFSAGEVGLEAGTPILPKVHLEQ